MSVRQYIGARYVPKFYENSLGTSEWVSGVEYEPLTIVTYNSNSYTSKRVVPASIGNPSDNPTYWVATGNYNEQISDLTNELTEVEAVKLDKTVKPFKALLFSDLHYANNSVAGVDCKTRFDNIMKFINSYEDIDVAFCLGDYTNDNYPYGPSGNMIYATQSLASANYLWRFEHPTYFLKGNHDSYPENMWNEYFTNKSQFVLNSEKLDFICLNVYGNAQSSSITGASFQYVDVSFLEDALSKAKNKVIILAHDLSDEQLTDSVRNVLNTYYDKIECIIAGHYHKWIDETITLSAGDLHIYHLPSIGGDLFAYEGTVPLDWQSVIDSSEKWSACLLTIDENGLRLTLRSMANTYTYGNESHTVTEGDWYTSVIDSGLTAESYADYKVITGDHDFATKKLGSNVLETMPLLSKLTDIQSGEDLNTYTKVGTYKCNTSGIANSLVNGPSYLSSGFLMYVMHPTSNNYDGSYCIQLVVSISDPNYMYIRSCNNGTWGKWAAFLSTRNLDMGSTAITNNVASFNVNNKYDLSVTVGGTSIIIPLHKRDATNGRKLYGSISTCNGTAMTTYCVEASATDTALTIDSAYKVTGSTIEAFTPTYVLHRSVGADVTFYN